MFKLKNKCIHRPAFVSFSSVLELWESQYVCIKNVFNFLLCEQFFSEPFGLFGGNISLMKNDENKWVLQKALSKIADVISYYQNCRCWFNTKPVQCVALQDRKQISFKIDLQMLKNLSVVDGSSKVVFFLSNMT